MPDVEPLLQYRTLPQRQQEAQISSVSLVINAKKWVSITRIWNREMNFVTRSGYPVPATNLYSILLLLLISHLNKPNCVYSCCAFNSFPAPFFCDHSSIVSILDDPDLSFASKSTLTPESSTVARVTSSQRPATGKSDNMAAMGELSNDFSRDVSTLSWTSIAVTNFIQEVCVLHLSVIV